MQTKDSPPRKRAWLGRRAAVPLALFFVVLAIYLHSVSFDFIYDDYSLILNEPAPNSIADLAAVFGEPHFPGLPYYRPVSRFTMVVQKFLHGDQPAAYHLFNAVLMACFGACVFALFRVAAFGIPTLVALLSAALVALHPAASCTVYPICSGRETLLPAFFAVAALRCYIGGSMTSYLAALTLFALALLSKEQAVVVPALFLLADTCGISATARPRTPAAWAYRYAPVVAIVLAYLLVRWQLFSGAREGDFALLARPLDPFLSLVFAWQTTCLPFAQLVYEPTIEVWSSLWRGLICLLALMLLATAAFQYWSAVRSRFLFWLGWAALCLLPSANIFEQEVPFAERWVLLSLVGTLGMLGTVASAAWERPAVRTTISIAGLIVLALAGTVSFQRGQYYRNERAFFQQWVATNPQSSQAQLCLGFLLFSNDELDKAEAAYQEALRIEPENARALAYLGELQVARGRFEEALTLMRRAVELAPHRAELQVKLGKALVDAGRPAEAVTHARRAITLHPDDADAHYAYARALDRLGELADAQSELEKTLLLRPAHVEALTDLGVVIARQGGANNTRRAQQCFRQALKIDPLCYDAHYNLGVSYFLQGNLKQAELHVEKALRLDPSHPMAGQTLRHIREAQGSRQSGS